MFKMSSVIATANTPSLNASRRPVDIIAVLLDGVSLAIRSSGRNIGEVERRFRRCRFQWNPIVAPRFDRVENRGKRLTLFSQGVFNADRRFGDYTARHNACLL